MYKIIKFLINLSYSFFHLNEFLIWSKLGNLLALPPQAINVGFYPKIFATALLT
jgi:hypothetical protein